MKTKEKVNLKNIAVVQYFSKDFSMIFLVCQPIKIEFSINVMLRTSPISITLYSISPFKLIKLKKQLEELLEKQFIHLNIFIIQKIKLEDLCI